jgi:hypothetical protein
MVSACVRPVGFHTRQRNKESTRKHNVWCSVMRTPSIGGRVCSSETVMTAADARPPLSKGLSPTADYLQMSQAVSLHMAVGMQCALQVKLKRSLQTVSTRTEGKACASLVWITARVSV